jgi:hypothetical protein
VEEALLDYHPAYVQPDAPKSARPALCMVTAAEGAGGSCGGSNQNVQRLCACQLAGGGGAAPAAGGSPT